VPFQVITNTCVSATMGAITYTPNPLVLTFDIILQATVSIVVATISTSDINCPATLVVINPISSIFTWN
jgi:hypothetical protein